MHHRPASDSNCLSDFGRMVGKGLADPLDQLSKRLIFTFARVGVAIKRDRVGPKHCLKIGGVAQSKLDISAAHGFYGLDRFRASLSGSAYKRLSELCEAFARKGSKNGLAVAEIMVGRLMADASFACHLAHTEPVKPSLFDQSKARIQHFLAEIRRISHDRKLFGSRT